MASTQNKRLVATGLLLAIAFILSFIKLYEMPWGGAVTLCSGLPIILIGYRYGNKWGLFSAFIFSILQLLFGLSGLRGISGFAVVVSILFDYLFAFTCLGLGGMFRQKIKQPAGAIALGAVVTLFLRYLCSVVSGWLVWGEYAADTLAMMGSVGQSILNTFSGWQLSFVYSIVYNACYMLPEIVLTAVVAAILMRVPQIAKQL